MKKSKAFTLVEVLVVIVILALLALLIIPNITKYTEKAKDKYNDSLKDELLLAGKDFYTNNRSRIPTSISPYLNDYVSLKELASQNYISKEFLDKNKNNCMDESYVAITRKEGTNKYNYNVCLICGGQKVVWNDNCSASKISQVSCEQQISNLSENKEKVNVEINYYHGDKYIDITIKPPKHDNQTVITKGELKLQTTAQAGQVSYKLINKATNKTLKIGDINKNIPIALIDNQIEGQEPQEYRLSFSQNNKQLNLKNGSIDIELNIKTKIEYNFDYKEKAQEFQVPVTGDYTIELWGAAGNYKQTKIDNVGKGAYTKGTITLQEGEKLYIYTGKNATDNDKDPDAYKKESFNAGSTAEGIKNYPKGATAESVTGYHNSSSGGGATDVRLKQGTNWNDEKSLQSRIMVAAGGGGTQYYYSTSGTPQKVLGIGGAGGGLMGYPGSQKFITGLSRSNIHILENYGKTTNVTGYNQEFAFVSGGSQTSGGLANKCIKNSKECDSESKGSNGSFGIGGNGSKNEAGGGGGGGYYGGGGGGVAHFTEAESGLCHSSGAGGSSYISGHTGSISYINKNNSSCNETVKSHDPAKYVGTTNKKCSYYDNNHIFKNTTMVDGQGYVWKNKRITEKLLDKPNTGSGKAKITSQNQSTTSTLKLTSETIDCTVKRVQSK